MKKIHDIKKRTHKKSEPVPQGNWLDNFWHGHGSTPVRRAGSSRVTLTGKRLFFAAVLVAIAMTATGRAYVVKAELSDNIRQAKTHLNTALLLLDYGEYDQALTECQQAKTEIDKIKLNLQSWGQNSQYLKIIDYRSDIVSAEMLITSTDSVLDIAGSTKRLIENMSDNLGGQELILGQEIEFKLNIEELKKHLSDKSKQISELNRDLLKRKSSDNYISSGDQQKIIQAFSALQRQIDGIQSNIIPLLEWYSGKDEDRNIMLLLQNNAEIRGSGGFIGSYAIIHTGNTGIRRIDFQTNIYKLDNAVKGKLGVAAPPEYDVLSQGNLYLRDANYAVNGPESLAEVMKMYKLESGNDLDGVIAIDTTFITSLLKIAGPINMPEYNMQVTADNFLKEVQTEVEYTYFQREGGKGENEPKKILAQMMPRLMEAIMTKIKSSEDRGNIIKSLKDAIAAKHFLLYSADAQIQSKIESLNLGAKLAEGDYDYLMSHSTNIGGGKSSLNIDEQVNDNITINEDGSIHHFVSIARKHNGDGKYPDYDNINLMRIIMPKDSKVNDFRPEMGNFWPHMDKKQQKAIDHYSGSEGGKDKLSFWMNTQPAGESKVSFNYTSGYKIDPTQTKEAAYKLYLQKQPGTKTYHYHLNIKYPSSWAYTHNYVHSDLQYEIDLDKDKLLELRFEL